MRIKVAVFLFFVNTVVFASQKAKIVSPDVEIYSKADFDSEVFATVSQGETYMVSDKNYGPFYRIKLKSGKVGYIVDYELDIEGKGPFKEKDLDDVLAAEAIKFAQETPEGQDEEEIQMFGRLYSGPTLQLINFNEETLGSGQTDNLLAVGYKNISLTSWSILGAFKVPKYYTEKTGGSASGFKLWGDFGFSNPVVSMGRSEIRFAGSLFSHFSFIQVETPLRKYDLHDITVGLALEFGWIYRFKKNAVDVAVKYYFDKSNYAGLGVSLLF